MNPVPDLKKRRLQKDCDPQKVVDYVRVEDYVTQKARVDQFNEDYNRWLTPWVIFLVVMILIGIGVWLVPVKACDLPPMDDTINGIRAEAI